MSKDTEDYTDDKLLGVRLLCSPKLHEVGHALPGHTSCGGFHPEVTSDRDALDGRTKGLILPPVEGQERARVGAQGAGTGRCQ
jgi:hypothetical protein